MNSKDDRQLELAVSRELKALPELTAPASLAGRVMAAIESRRKVPWHGRAWVTWPAGLQAASLAAMLALFGGLCLAGWEMAHSPAVLQAAHGAGHWFAGLNTIGSLFGILADAAVLVVKKLGPAFIIACLVAVGVGYAVFMGAGTYYFRVAFAKR